MGLHVSEFLSMINTLGLGTVVMVKLGYGPSHYGSELFLCALKMLYYLKPEKGSSIMIPRMNKNVIFKKD